VADLEAGLRVISISDPTDPQEVGFCDTPGLALGVAVSGSYAYVADYHAGPRVISISDPTDPQEVGCYDTPEYALGVAVSGSYAYLTEYGVGLRVISISDPTNPQEVGFCATPGSAYNVAVSGSYAYLADCESGLRVISIADPTNPQELGFYDTLGLTWDLAVSGSYAFLADDLAGLRVIDVSDPTNPQEVGFCDTPGNATDVEISGDYAYLADDASGLRVISIADPTDPQEVGFCDTPGRAYGVAVSGSYAYLADYDTGLRVIDVSDPTDPQEVGFYDTPGNARDVTVSGSYAYLAADDAGLCVISILDPANPQELGFYDTPGIACTVGVGQGLVALADWEWGLILFPACRLDFVGSPVSGTVPLTVDFTSLLPGALPALLWDFGDGNTSTDPNPSHLYETVGHHTVSLTAANGGGSNTETKTGYITVTFPDVTLDHWACEEVLSCVDAGIVKGYLDGLYRPAWPVTRGQMAVYVARAMLAPSGQAALADYVPAAPRNFPDVPEDFWAYPHIEYCAEQNVLVGYGDGTYHPEYKVTRDQMAVYVARAMVAPSGEAGLADYLPAAPRNFPDVPEDFWSYTHVEYCFEHGVVQGYDGYYHPELVVTRDQMAVYVARAFGLLD